MRRKLCLLVVLLVNVALAASAQEEPPVFSDQQVAFFEQEVLPILQRNCFSCHGGEAEVEGSFRITSRAGVLSGGDLGPAVDLDDPEASELLAAVNYESVEMPPAGKLPDAQIEVITKWVADGLPWPQKEDYGVAPAATTDMRGDGSDYWAYQPIRRPVVPEVKHQARIQNPIDAFILAELEAAQIEPNGAADKRTLIRRAYYTLIGLPPTPDEVDEFTEDDSPDAFEHLVNRLLASPQYGERWGRHWLDLVRYAETHGYERDSAKPEAWRYRDYVINSLNEDKPYDQFVIEQLAGDELPQVTSESLTATGFYRLGIWDDEPVDRAQARYDGLDDIVKTASEVVLGTSMGCVRCHSHKADPFNHDEYYQFLAYFHDISDGTRDNLRRWVTDEDQQLRDRQLQEKQQQETSLSESIREIEGEFRQLLATQLNIKLTEQNSESGERVLLADSRQQPQKWEYTFDQPSEDWIQSDYSTTSWDEGRAGFGRKGTPGAVVRTAWESTDIWLRKWFEVETVPAQLALDLHFDNDCEIYLNGQLIHEAKGHTTDYVRVPLDQRAGEALKTGRNVLAIHCRQHTGGQYIDVGMLSDANLDLKSALERYGASVLGKEQMRSLATLRKQLTDSKKRKVPPVGTPIMSVQQADRGPVHVLIRGNAQAKGDPVSAAVPKVFRTAAPDVQPGTNQLGSHGGKRLAIARWMFQRDNPMTARVLVNRLWQHHFGRGIVPTTNDFGKLGQQPSHPELLDYLATELRDGGWKLKRMHKLIMLSAAWQMSSQGRDQPLAVDPGNRMFWRQNMRRLSSEEVRDSMLSATGELNLERGGPSIYVPIAQEVLQGQSRPGAGWGKSPPDQAARRSIYIHVKRSLLVPILEMHDQADTDSSCPVRYVTTVPTQSLGMLNGQFTNARAKELAERLRREVPDDRQEQVRSAIRVTTGRTPEAEEVREDMQLLESLEKDHQLSREAALTAYCLLVLNTNEFIYLD